MTGYAYVDRVCLVNSHTTERQVVLEPWGMPLWVPPGASCEVCMGSSVPGTIEVDHVDENCIVVCGWVGCQVQAHVDGVEVYSTQGGPPVPGVAPGMTVGAFVRGLFGH